eukprot:3436128-Rhodomonas_salina.1
MHSTQAVALLLPSHQTPSSLCPQMLQHQRGDLPRSERLRKGRGREPLLHLVRAQVHQVWQVLPRVLFLTPTCPRLQRTPEPATIPSGVVCYFCVSDSCAQGVVERRVQDWEMHLSRMTCKKKGLC